VRHCVTHCPTSSGEGRSGKLPVWLLVLLLPQSVPFSLPLTLLMSVVCGWTGRTITPRIRRFVITLGLAGSLVSFGTIVWVVPEANQAYRVAIARQVVVRGESEMPPRTLRTQALALRSQGRTEKAGTLFFSYHARWALAGAAGVFLLSSDWGLRLFDEVESHPWQSVPAPASSTWATCSN
jgi:hypothetical protein